ncbi:hypothetical protein F5Y10DRAFT_280167 [Nemania abortiva]|nr:hypothetical protein F5Y10DRAFT_280167 [Nemania abortiva]
MSSNISKSKSKSKSRHPRTPTRASKRLKERLLDTVAEDVAEDRAGCLPNKSAPYPTGVSLTDVPLKPTKRRLEETDRPTAKRPRISTEIEEAAAQPADETTITQHPKPKHPRAAFLEPNPRLGSAGSFISEWLESIGSDRNTHCRPDSYLSQVVREPVPRQHSTSAPQAGFTWDADGYLKPWTPASIESRSQADIDGASAFESDTSGYRSRSSRKSLFENSGYRIKNLALNNIYMRSPCDKLPKHIADLVNNMGKDRNSPGPSLDDVLKDKKLERLNMNNARKAEVEEYFELKIFPIAQAGDILMRAQKQPMPRNAAPNTGSNFEVSLPMPDMLYGYDSHVAFPQQQAQLISMGSEMNATNQETGPLYPFLLIEFLRDGGDLWATTNQCLGGSASCVNIAERLNYRLAQCKGRKVRRFNSATFSIALSSSEVRLFVTWKHNELDYYTARVDSFLLQEPESYLEFRKYVLNIIEWGGGKRLKDIRSSLDILWEESRRIASGVAKSRPPPVDEPATGNKRGKSSRRQTRGAEQKV